MPREIPPPGEGVRFRIDRLTRSDELLIVEGLAFSEEVSPEPSETFLILQTSGSSQALTTEKIVREDLARRMKRYPFAALRVELRESVHEPSVGGGGPDNNPRIALGGKRQQSLGKSSRTNDRPFGQSAEGDDEADAPAEDVDARTVVGEGV